MRPLHKSEASDDWSFGRKGGKLHAIPSNLLEASISPALRVQNPAERGAVPLLQARDGQCRFILRQNPAICCGAPTSEASSWCDCHRAIVYQADAPRKIRVSYR